MGITKENFREVYEKYKNLVLRQVYDMTQDYYLAQDVCQETFAKLYHYMDRVDEYGVKRWLYVVSYNKACDWLRRNKKYNQLIEENGEQLARTAEDSMEDHFSAFYDREWCDHLLRKVREKNQVWYEMLLLFDYYGVPKREIAKHMGYPIGTVDTYLRRCKKWLKDNFQEEYEMSQAEIRE